LSIPKTSLCQQGGAGKGHGKGQQEGRVFKASLLKNPVAEHMWYGSAIAKLRPKPGGRVENHAGRQAKKGQKGLNKANRSHEINDLTQKTNPKQSQ